MVYKKALRAYGSVQTIMEPVLSFLQWIFLVPSLGGSIYAILCLFAVFSFLRSSRPVPSSFRPPVTILKPLRGVEKNQKTNLRSACLQDYPEYQVVFSVQDIKDPAIPLLWEIQREFGEKKVSVVIENHQAGPNGKINNLLGAFPYALHDILVISDSDVRLQADYLKTIVAPFSDPQVGCVCTLYRGTRAERWFEKMELLNFNADFIPSVLFAHVSGASKFCLGPSMALRRSSLEEIGGFEGLADYLVEDYEIGRRLWSSGKRVSIVPYFVDIVVNLDNAFQWWNHQIYWDQNTRAARPAGFFASVLTRSVPFALLFAATRLGDSVGMALLAGVLGLRLAAAGVILGWALNDGEGLKSLPLLPLRDIAALASWVLAFTKKTVIWRGCRFTLTRDGRLLPKEARR